MSEQELKPCPFCGSESLDFDEPDERGWWYVECNKCTTQGGISKKKITALKKWNIRTTLNN